MPFEYLSHVIVTKGHSSDEEIGPETVVAELRFPQGSPDATAQVFLAPGSFPNGQAGGAGPEKHALTGGTEAAFQLLLLGKKVWRGGGSVVG